MKKYIDADIINLKLKQICDNRNTSYGIQFGGRAKDFAQLTDDIPAADVEEVKHGKWIDKLVECNGVAEIKSVCSLCGNPNKQYKPPYCPHCGAKMDKE